jgi:electron transport complex protein RnfC
MKMFQFFNKKTFAHGIHPPEHKTTAKPIIRLPFADKSIVLLSQHIGKPAIPIVHLNQEVTRGELIATADGFMSIPMHSPVDGIVEKIDLMPAANGIKTKAIVIKTSMSSSQQIFNDTLVDPDEMSRQEIIKAVQNTGMVGLGGAGFPTHVKLSVPDDYEIDTLIANGCECEPYLTSDHRVMLENSTDLINGINILMRACGAKQAIIGIEDNKLDVYNKLKPYLAKYNNIEIKLLKNKYPQGAEKMLTTALLGREVPSGGFPYQIGVLIQNVATLAQLGNLIPKQQGLIERVVTIAGAGIKNPGNYLAAIGTPLRFILEQLGYNSHELNNKSQVILGGPMMGNSIASLDVPLTKATGGLIVLPKNIQDTKTDKQYPCIRCAECVNVCPIHLNPSQLGILAKKQQYEIMQNDFNLNDCFECGSCSYVCPSNIPLVQYFRIAKSINRGRAA